MAGPFEGLGKDDLPSQLCAFTAGVLRAEARHEPGYYDVVHSHYWLSGQVGWLARDRWGVPLVHTAHTLARVKNAALAAGDTPEPRVRVIGEDQVVAEADRLVANTEIEAKQLIELYDADPHRTVTIPPGVDTDRFRPGMRSRRAGRAGHRPGRRRARVRRAHPAAQGAGRAAARGRRAARPRPRRCATGWSCSSRAGRRAAGCSEPTVACRSWPPSWASPTSSGSCRRAAATTSCRSTGPPTSSPCPATTSRSGWWRWRRRRAGPRSSRPGSAGCRSPSPTGRSGLLVTGHDISDWADALAELIADPDPRAERMGGAAAAHALRFSWDRTTDALLGAYDEARHRVPGAGRRGSERPA